MSTQLPRGVSAVPSVPLRALGYIGPPKFSRLNLRYHDAVEALERFAAQIARKEGRAANLAEVFHDEELVDGQTWFGVEGVLAAVKEGTVDLLVVLELAHLVRSARKFTAFTSFLRQHGTRLLALRDHLDTGALSPDALAEFAQRNFPSVSDPTPVVPPAAPALLDINTDGFRLLEPSGD